MQRRSFLKSLGRGLALTGLSFIAYQTGIRDSDNQESNVCRLSLPCRKCAKQQKCTDTTKRDYELTHTAGNINEQYKTK